MSKLQVFYSPSHARRVEIRQASQAVKFWLQVAAIMTLIAIAIIAVMIMALVG